MAKDKKSKTKRPKKDFTAAASDPRSLGCGIALDKPIYNVHLSKMRCTQIAVGMLQVEEKQEKLHDRRNKPVELVEFLLEHPIRVVMGPDNQAYIIDHHHLGLALMREGFETVPVEVVDTFEGEGETAFWAWMEDKKYVYPFDEDGKKRPVSDIPKCLSRLKDDPYRSLAGFVRNAGGYDKDMTPFTEFQWANYFRANIPKKLVKKDFKKALKLAMELAHGRGAASLPGFNVNPG